MITDKNNPLFKADYAAVDDRIMIENFHVDANKITCIVGESGGGKSTLLRMLNKLISPTEGTLYYQGKDLSDIDSIEHRKEVVLLSQKPYIFPGTIQDNLEKGLIFHGKRKDESAMKACLSAVKLSKTLNDDAKNLSGGEAQRLALARVMLLDADVVLLDEPSSALDEETEKEVIQAIVSYVKKASKTLVMVTHSKQVAQQYGDLIYTIDKGKITGRDTNGR